MEFNEIIEYIKKMDITDKLRLGISVFSSAYININCNKKKIFEEMDKQLKSIDKNYIMTFSGIYNNKLIMLLTARIAEFSKEEQNRVAMYLVNCV